MLISRDALSEDYGLIRELYGKAFPEQERIPFDTLVSTAGRGGNFITYLDGEKFAGFSFTFKGTGRPFLVYLAFEEGSRGKGLGSQALADIRKRFGDGVFTVMEMPESGFTSPELCESRRRFYERNGGKVPGIPLLSDGYEFDSVWLGSPATEEEMKKAIAEYENLQKEAGEGAEYLSVPAGASHEEVARKLYEKSYGGLRKIPFDAFQREGEVVLITVGGEPAGYYATVDENGKCLIVYMEVEEKFRGQRLATEALRHLKKEHWDETVIVLPDAPGVDETMKSSKHRLVKYLGSIGFRDQLARYTLLGNEYQITADGRASADDVDKCVRKLRRASRR